MCLVVDGLPIEKVTVPVSCVVYVNRSDCYRLERQLPGGFITRWGESAFPRRPEKFGLDK